jgi:hypothetical protein
MYYGFFPVPHMMHRPYEASESTSNGQAHGCFGFFPSAVLVNRTQGGNYGGNGSTHVPLCDYGSYGEVHDNGQWIHVHGNAHVPRHGQQHEYSVASPVRQDAYSPSRRKKKKALLQMTSKGSTEQHEHFALECGNSACCPEVQVSDADSSNRVRVNSHCSFPGHCVQLKNTFIHVACPAHSDAGDSDCELCKLARPRARSLELTRTRARSLDTVLRNNDSDEDVYQVLPEAGKAEGKEGLQFQ